MNPSVRVFIDDLEVTDQCSDFVWEIDHDGARILRVAFQPDVLAPGRHLINVRVTNADGVELVADTLPVG